MAIGIALHCTVSPSTFHRKNYFYPDMPKDYQISQYDRPINVGGYLDLPDGSRVGIVRAHIEEDTGKTTHLGTSGRIHGADRSLVDYNRSGVPLVEIVSEPDMTTPEQARAYAQELRGILVASGASDGRMEEGSMRIDANVSVRRPGEDLGTRCEIKNLNSLRSLLRAVEFEALRQVDLLEAGGKVRQETRHWDEDRGETSTLRTKEEAEDYRYFLEPDLVELAPSDAWRQSVADAIGQMPAERRRVLADLVPSASPSQLESVAVAVEIGVDDMVRAAVDQGIDPALAIARAANELAGAAQTSRLSTASFVRALSLEQGGDLSATQSKMVLAELLELGGDADDVVRRRGFERLDSTELETTLDRLLADHPDEWERYRAGEDKLAQFFIGLVMKETKGQANGRDVIAGLASRR
jgi:aspartyl-tRNA(Asn)/glutamyl-tRNA(Gln) amidotransferase subunit B